jgi:hypothetical protein
MSVNQYLLCRLGRNLFPCKNTRPVIRSLDVTATSGGSSIIEPAGTMPLPLCPRAMIQEYYPRNVIPPKTQFFIEEIFDVPTC